MDKSNKILKRLELLHPKKIDLSLIRIKKLLKKMNNPHLNLPEIIHIAGTNGKGSVTSFLRSIFETSKLKVHTYTSPHLIRFNERIRINSELISNYDLNLILEECESFNKGEPITFFEITTAAAFLAFSKFNSDVILMETGLGGRFDATNIIEKKKCSVITPISMDHMNFLGNSIMKIAKEKTGILKNSEISIISKQKTSVRKIIRAEAKKLKIKLYEEGVNWKILDKNSEEKKFILNFENIQYKFNFPKLYGEHQIENASTAIATALSLKHEKVKINNINQGLLNVSWPARMQKLDNGKLSSFIGPNFEIWLDGGHNIDASNMLKNIFNNWDNNADIFMVMGMTIGKNPQSFLNKIIKRISGLFLLPIANHQYIQPYEIKRNIKSAFKLPFEIECCLDIIEALKIIKKNRTNGKIIICGSLYLAGEILKEDGFKIS